MPPVPPPPPPEERRRGSDAATDDLVPLTHRGGISIESAVFTSAEERRLAGGSIALEARARLATHLYLDVRLPLSLAIGVSVGNPTLELRGMVPLGSGRDFIIAGGGMGFPVLDDSQLTDTAVIGNLANAMWDIHEHSPSTIPMVYRFGTEHHLGNIVILRTQIDPIINVPVGRNTDPELQIQHAVEAQIGRRTGGGFRIQGVAMPTWEDAELRELEDDLYQLAMEPFLALERERLGTRVGLLIPVDEIAGPPFVTSWGLRFMMAARLD